MHPELPRSPLQRHRIPFALAGAALAVMLAGCGGGGDSDTAPPVVDADKFTQSATWTVALPATGGQVCYDFDAAAEADCAGSTWDLKLTNSGLAGALWTHSGTSGSGQGGAFGGPFDHTWTELSAWQNATTDPTSGAIPATLFFADGASGVFAGSNAIQSAAFEYGLAGTSDHLLYPNYRVFLVTSDSSKADTTTNGSTRVFALQVIGYYGSPTGTASGWPTVRWVDTADPAHVKTATLDATADWVYLNLDSGTPVGAGDAWHVAFSRYNMRLNGGTSGSGSVAGFLAKTPAGLYDTDGKPVLAAFQAATPAGTLAELTAPDLAKPASAGQWVKDGRSSVLNPAYQGSYPAPLDYGWYTYYPTATAAEAAGLPAVAHLLKANPERATMLRGAGGTSYARIHVTDIGYATPGNARSQQTWTLQMDIQPAP